MKSHWIEFWLKHRERLRPFFRETVPPRLCLDWHQDEHAFTRLLKEVGFRVRMGLRYGFLSFLGEKSEQQLVQAWKPQELFLIDKLAIAVSCVKERLAGGIIPDQIHVERLTELVYQWRRRWEVTLARDSVAEAVETAVCSRLSEHAVTEDEAPRRILVNHPLLDELYEIEETLEMHVPDIESVTTFREISLSLAKPLGEGRYFCTPLNCTPFACTGGDGTHYSLLQLDGEINDKSPVVMTMPANSGFFNFIVGETLHDFLCLGMEWGYSSLEQIGYNDQHLDFYLDGHPNCEPSDFEELTNCMNPTKRKILDLLKARFDLKPWNDAGHWQELQAKYMSLLHEPPSL